MSDARRLTRYKRESLDVTEAMHDSEWYKADEVQAMMKEALELLSYREDCQDAEWDKRYTALSTLLQEIRHA